MTKKSGTDSKKTEIKQKELAKNGNLDGNDGDK